MKENMSSGTGRIQPNNFAQTPQFLSNADLKLLLVVILAISIAGMVAVLVFAVDRLKWHNISVVRYFFSEQTTPNASKVDKEEFDYLRKGFADSLEKRDWGMAGYYSKRIKQIY